MGYELRSGVPAADDRMRDPLDATASPKQAKSELATGLLRQFAGGRREALGELYDACRAELHGLALWRTGDSEDAADAVQEVFVRLSRTGARLEGVRDGRSYLFKMTQHAAIDLLRKRTDTDPLDDHHPLLVATEGAPERALHARLLTDALARLSPEQRDAVYLRHIAGMTWAEVGRSTGVTLFTAASRGRLGMRRLRIIMEGTQ